MVELCHIACLRLHLVLLILAVVVAAAVFAALFRHQPLQQQLLAASAVQPVRLRLPDLSCWLLRFAKR
jgi:hypothetical protein